MLNGPPETIVAILRSAQTGNPDPRLEEVLEGFRRQWMSIARRRYPGLQNDLEDAVQSALLKLLSGEKLDRLKDASRLEAWARSVFVNTVMDFARDGARHRRRRTYLGQADEDPEDVLRDHVATDQPTPEEMTAYHERLAIVARCVDKVEVARLRFVDDLPEKEIAARQRLSRDAVAGQLKRLRKGLRVALEEPE